MTAKDPDVIVIGAGPSGAIASALLVQKGYSVLVLEREEILVRLEVGIGFDACQQPTERAGQRRLRFLELLDLGGIGKVGRIDLNGRRLGARFGHLRQHCRFLLGKALHGFDEIRDQVQTTLIHVLDLRPGRIYSLI